LAGFEHLFGGVCIFVLLVSINRFLFNAIGYDGFYFIAKYGSLVGNMAMNSLMPRIE
jgi:hypothetical protein